MSKLKFKGKNFNQLKTYSDEKPWDSELNPIRWTTEFPDVNQRIRIVGNLFPVKYHWVTTKPNEDLGIKNVFERKGKIFPFICPDYDQNEEVSSAETCAICKDFSDRSLLGMGSTTWYLNAFVEKRKSGGKTKWSSEPLVLTLPQAAISEIKTIVDGVGNGTSPEDAKNGYALWIMYSTKNKKWSISKDEGRLPLSKFDFNEDDVIDFSEYYKPSDPKIIKDSLTRLGYYEYLKKKNNSESVSEESEDDEDGETMTDDDDDSTKKSKKKKHDFEDDDEDDDEDEDEKPSKKSKKRHDDEDDEDSDDDEDDDEDEDEKPSKKSKKSHDEDDDEDGDDSDEEDDEDSDEDEDDDEDEDEDEKPSKKSKKKKHHDEDEDDEDEDEKPSKKSKKKKHHDEDDDDEDDDEDDDDDDDLPF